MELGDEMYSVCDYVYEISSGDHFDPSGEVFEGYVVVGLTPTRVVTIGDVPADNGDIRAFSPPVDCHIQPTRRDAVQYSIEQVSGQLARLRAIEKSIPGRDESTKQGE